MARDRPSAATGRDGARVARTGSTFDVSLLRKTYGAKQKRRQLMLLRLHGRCVVLAVETGSMFRVALLLRRTVLLATRLVLSLRPNRCGLGYRLCHHHLLRRRRNRSGRLHPRNVIVEFVGTELVLALASASGVLMLATRLAVFADFEIFHRLARNGRLDEMLDRAHLPFVARGCQHECMTDSPRASRSSDAMHIIVGMERNVEVEDVADGRDI